MALNVPNLDKLIAHLEAQPPERINMGWVDVEDHPCGTCGCIIGHAALLFSDIDTDDDYTVFSKLGLTYRQGSHLTTPEEWIAEKEGSRRYPAHRVIATLKRLRDRFLATGEIVVDWGAEPGSEPAQAWSAPRAVEITPPALPETLTRLLAADRAPATEVVR